MKTTYNLNVKAGLFINTNHSKLNNFQESINSISSRLTPNFFLLFSDKIKYYSYFYELINKSSWTT